MNYLWAIRLLVSDSHQTPADINKLPLQFGTVINYRGPRKNDTVDQKFIEFIEFRFDKFDTKRTIWSSKMVQIVHFVLNLSIHQIYRIYRYKTDNFCLILIFFTVSTG